jgi:hypothetical protein
MGGGHIQPDKAIDPGLVYDIQPEEYFKFKEENEEHGLVYELNLPSIALPDLKKSITVSRTVINIGPAKATYRTVVEAPAGVRMSVEPPVIAFQKGGARNVTFKVTFVAKQSVQGGYAFGSLTWLDDGKHSVWRSDRRPGLRRRHILSSSGTSSLHVSALLIQACV